MQRKSNHPQQAGARFAQLEPAPAAKAHRSGVLAKAEPPQPDRANASVESLQSGVAPRDVLLARAVNGLSASAPQLSARTGLWGMQKLLLAGFAVAALTASYFAPWLAAGALVSALICVFAVIVALRFAILVRAGRASLAGLTRKPPLGLLSDRQLPGYTVLVPLLGEANMLPQIVAALSRLDYPPAKLDIKLVLESIDQPTIAAARAIALPQQFEIVIVPDCQPRTKPKALNFALQLARGEFVTVFDAEDVPDRDQLRRAASEFAKGRQDLACVQAALAIDNSGDGFLARQFAIEYLSLFRGILPALQAFRLPIPLGGTSNHFRIRQLVELGGWDPFNVTEDADLGIRLARARLRCCMLEAETCEEAPRRLGDWMKQRTRWMKGWMQTYIVHTRQPLKLLGELGPRAWIGFHAILGGVLLSALLHPIAYLLLGYQFATGSLLTGTDGEPGRVLVVMAVLNLVGGYVAAILLALLTVLRHGDLRMVMATLAIPLYWLMISFAAYRALWQLFWQPFLWEKTEHGVSKCRQRLSDIGSHQQ